MCRIFLGRRAIHKLFGRLLHLERRAIHKLFMQLPTRTCSRCCCADSAPMWLLLRPCRDCCSPPMPASPHYLDPATAGMTSFGLEHYGEFRCCFVMLVISRPIWVRFNRVFITAVTAYGLHCPAWHMEYGKMPPEGIVVNLEAKTAKLIHRGQDPSAQDHHAMGIPKRLLWGIRPWVFLGALPLCENVITF